MFTIQFWGAWKASQWVTVLSTSGAPWGQFQVQLHWLANILQHDMGVFFFSFSFADNETKTINLYIVHYTQSLSRHNSLDHEWKSARNHFIPDPLIFNSHPIHWQTVFLLFCFLFKWFISSNFHVKTIEVFGIAIQLII